MPGPPGVRPQPVTEAALRPPRFLRAEINPAMTGRGCCSNTTEPLNATHAATQRIFNDRRTLRTSSRVRAISGSRADIGDNQHSLWARPLSD